MDTVGNVNHEVSIFGYWIFDSNYKKALTLTTKGLNLIYSTLFGEGMFAMFETVFYEVKYVNNKEILNIDD